MKKFIKHPAAFHIWGILICFLAWELLPRILGLSDSILPPFSEVVRQIADAHVLLGRHVYITVFQTVISFSIVIPIGFAMAILSVESQFIGRLILQPIVAIQNVPKVAVVPLLVLWFGYGSTNKIATGVLIGFYPLFEATRLGMLHQSSELKEALMVLSPSRFMILVKVTLPAAVPSILSGAKMSLSLCLIGVIVAQIAQPSEGLGYIISVSNEEFKTSLLFGGVLLISAIGVVLHMLMLLLENSILGKYSLHSRSQESIDSGHISGDDGGI